MTAQKPRKVYQIVQGSGLYITKGCRGCTQSSKRGMAMPGAATTGLPYTEYYTTIWRARNQ